ncbi:hypothetical protein [Vibrio cholerae]|uniref:hypothetical protein n=1 Tax=Vibrio cholerae TaxID=666 RepID=UPI0018F0958E|nr:hypothetical protein [Vibrio cholerae]ELF5327280.1 hypothetical protein [Vibrio cholerae]MBJ6954509.1 hypothetical protein [Vibrio cholerae]GIC09561.1 hypothetical protein VCSRO191_3433 [Vibrio cholerae]
MADVNQSSNQNSSEEKVNSRNGGFISTATTFLFWLIIGSTFLWNWDGFWQTDIKLLNNIQSEYFSSKYNEEQLKLSRIANNNYLIESITERLDTAEKRADDKVQKAYRERDMAISKLNSAEVELANYLEKENMKCRFYDTSLRMIDHLTKKYSEDDLKRVLSCTSVECEKILNYRQEATAICG